MHKELLNSLSLLLVLTLTNQSALAQFGQGQTPLTPQEKRKKAKEKFKTTAIMAPVPIPNVPEYPAQKGQSKFVRALKYSSLGQGDNCIVQSFLLKEPPDNVRNWYSQTLSNYGWLIQPANAANTQILARRRKEGASCHIMVSPSPEAGFKSFVQIRYVQFQPLVDD